MTEISKMLASSQNENIYLVVVSHTEGVCMYIVHYTILGGGGGDTTPLTRVVEIPSYRVPYISPPPPCLALTQLPKKV